MRSDLIGNVVNVVFLLGIHVVLVLVSIFLKLMDDKFTEYKEYGETSDVTDEEDKRKAEFYEYYIRSIIKEAESLNISRQELVNMINQNEEN